MERVIQERILILDGAMGTMIGEVLGKLDDLIKWADELKAEIDILVQ